MTTTSAERRDREALAALFGPSLDPIDQLFLHSRMLRAWGHSLGALRHREWIEKMRRSLRIGALLIARGGLPPGRPAGTLEIGHDAETILASDRRLAERFVREATAALEAAGSDEARVLLAETVEAERADLAQLDGWLRGPEAREARRDARHQSPKPGSEAASIAALAAALPATVAAVSQIFIHSMVFRGTGRAEEAERELQAALRMMYRSEALLERLLDLGAAPTDAGREAIAVDAGDHGADRTALAVHERLLDLFDGHIDAVDPHGDPGTWALLDGMRRAIRDEAAEIAARLAA